MVLEWEAGVVMIALMPSGLFLYMHWDMDIICCHV